MRTKTRLTRLMKKLATGANDMNITPITETTPACFGVACEKHGQCARYIAIDGAPAHQQRIGHCTPTEHSARPLFIAIKESHA